jgi:hypothetical protein
MTSLKPIALLFTLITAFSCNMGAKEASFEKASEEKTTLKNKKK